MEYVLGLGHDVVDVAAFEAQLAEPGSRMRGLFSPRELRQAAVRARKKNDGEAVHLAARWAGKEAVLKAWCEALGDAPNPYSLDDFPWPGIEILDDSRGRPQIVLASAIRQSLETSVVDGTPSGVSFRWHISLSHDGPIASAVALLTVRDPGRVSS